MAIKNTRYGAARTRDAGRTQVQGATSPAIVPPRTVANCGITNTGFRGNPYAEAQAKEYVISSGRSKKGA